MTGVSWGEYGDYLDGKFDGKQHWDEAQVSSDGKQVLDGSNPKIPYMAPSASYGRFLIHGIQKALDAGAEAIYLEEPEFWAKSGWSESFQREWSTFYHEPWQAPDSSPDAQYRASKLKYFLYRRALAQVFGFVREYSKTHNRRIPCYVATHSMINYAQWRIVSPESSLIQAGNDGYIAQVWTGTARAENVYRGERRERTFEAAFLEYGAMQNLVRASGRRIWYLNDPIEENPNHSWDDYRSNWESTLVASLLQPEVASTRLSPGPNASSTPAVFIQRQSRSRDSLLRSASRFRRRTRRSCRASFARSARCTSRARTLCGSMPGRRGSACFSPTRSCSSVPRRLPPMLISAPSMAWLCRC
jgi:hypothetical protein